jgi:hypothetical protein
MMSALLLILVPLIALVIWAVVFDVKRRRRHAPLTSHDISSAARRARAGADARRDVAGGSDSGPAPGM